MTSFVLLSYVSDKRFGRPILLEVWLFPLFFNNVFHKFIVVCLNVSNCFENVSQASLVLWCKACLSPRFEYVLVCCCNDFSEELIFLPHLWPFQFCPVNVFSCRYNHSRICYLYFFVLFFLQLVLQTPLLYIWSMPLSLFLTPFLLKRIIIKKHIWNIPFAFRILLRSKRPLKRLYRK